MAIKLLDTIFTDLIGRDLSSLKGNAANRMEKFQYDVEIDFAAVLSLTVAMEKVGSVLTLTTGNWSDYGFTGQTLTFTGFGNGPPKTGIVDYVDGPIMVLSGGTFVPVADGLYTKGTVRLIQLPKIMDFYFNLVGVNGVQNETSLIDGEAQRFRATAVDVTIPAVGNTMSMVQQGNKSGGSEFSTTLERLPDGAGGIFRFRIYSPFRIWLVNLPDIYQSIGTPVAYFKVVAFSDATDSKAALSKEGFSGGNCGYTGEAYNGGTPNYELNSLVWTDDLAGPLAVMDFNQNSNFTVRIDRKAGVPDFTAGHKFNFFMFTNPKEVTEYKNLPLSHDRNLMLASSTVPIAVGGPISIIGLLNEAGAGYDITGFTIVNNASHVIITGKVVPNAAFKALMELRDPKDRQYKIWIRCEDPALSYEESDAMNVVVEETNAVKVPVPLGPYPDLSFFDQEDHDDVTLIGAPIKEDDIVSIARFTLPLFAPNGDWLEIGMRTIVRNIATGAFFILEETNFWLGTIPTIGDGTRPLSFSTPNGFKLAESSGRLNTTLRRYLPLDAVGVYGLEFKYPALIRWEYWEDQLNAANDFFETANKDWRHYDVDPNYDVLTQLVIRHKDGQYIDDKNFIADIRNYNDWGETSAFIFQLLDLTAITNPIQNETIKISATHQIAAATWAGNEWGELTFEPFEGGPRYNISTKNVFGTQLDNPLQPLAGETGLKMTVAGDTVTLECTFNAALYPLLETCSFTTRIEGDTNTPGHVSNRLKLTVPISPKSTTFQEEDRGFSFCDEFDVKADLNSAKSERNDINSAYDRGDTVVFRLLKSDGSLSAYVPVTNPFVNDNGAYYTTIQWKDVITVDGFDVYTLEYDVTTAGILETKTWAVYNVEPYLSDWHRNSEGEVRLLSLFNQNSQKLNINFTGSFVQDTIRFVGKFGFWQQNLEVDNVVYDDDTEVNVKRREKFDYELRVNPSYRHVISKILLHLVTESTCWASDYNRDNDTYILNKAVIVKEGFVAEHDEFIGSRLVGGVAKFNDKLNKNITNFHNNGTEAEVLFPPVIPAVVIDSGSVGALLMKTNQTVSYRTGDDGDKERGRLVSFLVLASNNPFGNTNRFTDELGGQTYTNNIIIDWSQYNGAVVNGYYNSRRTGGDWNFLIDDALALSVGGFATWFMCNVAEYEAIFNWGSASSRLNYAPFSTASALTYLASTTNPASTSQCMYVLSGTGARSVVAKTNAGLGYMPMRPFTNAELSI